MFSPLKSGIATEIDRSGVAEDHGQVGGRRKTTSLENLHNFDETVYIPVTEHHGEVTGRRPRTTDLVLENKRLQDELFETKNELIKVKSELFKCNEGLKQLMSNRNSTQCPMVASPGPVSISGLQGHTRPYSQNSMSASAGQTDVCGQQGLNRINTIYTNASGTGQVGANSQQPHNWQGTQQANAPSSRPPNAGLHISSYDTRSSAANSSHLQPSFSTAVHCGSDLGTSSGTPTQDEWQTFIKLSQTEGPQRCLMLMGMDKYNRCQEYYIKHYTGK